MASPTVQSVAANLTRKAANDLILTAKAMPEEKARWQPSEETRSAIEQLAECCLANTKWAAILQTHVDANLPEGVAAQTYAELNTLEKVTARLQETADQLADVIHNIPDGDMALIVPFSWKPEAGRPLAECCFHAYWNLVYHLGQISYIQTLYGDQEEHCDAGPFGEMDAVP